MVEALIDRIFAYILGSASDVRCVPKRATGLAAGLSGACHTLDRRLPTSRSGQLVRPHRRQTAVADSRVVWPRRPVQDADRGLRDSQRPRRTPPVSSARLAGGRSVAAPNGVGELLAGRMGHCSSFLLARCLPRREGIMVARPSAVTFQVRQRPHPVTFLLRQRDSPLRNDRHAGSNRGRDSLNSCSPRRPASVIGRLTGRIDRGTYGAGAPAAIA